MRHIISATTLEGGAQLAMCGYVFEPIRLRVEGWSSTGYERAVQDGHRVGNYFRPASLALSAYHAEGVDCEACIVKHADTCKRYA